MSKAVSISDAVTVLSKGGVVGLPTETVYGLAASLKSDEGIREVFRIKERPFFDPLIVHCASLEQVQSVVSIWTPAHQLLAQRFWPGPLTMIVPKKSVVSDLVTSGLPSVGVRIPSHPVALSVIQQLGCPVAAPSANKFGKTSPTTAQHVRDEFGPSVVVLEGGSCDVGIESSVIEIVEDKTGLRIFILRPGMIQERDLKDALKSLGKEVSIETSSSNAAPGQLENHYQPSLPLVLIGSNSSKAEVESFFLRNYDCKPQDAVELKLPEEATIAARVLYSEMRRLSQTKARLIFFAPSAGQLSASWKPLWNRLERAASARL